MQFLDIEYLYQTAEEAGRKILAVYNDPKACLEVSYKSDHSPLTQADQAANSYIVSCLKARYPSIPIISEEGESEVDYEIRKSWEYFWLVDPLDGTKEFVKRNGEFTVNIALIYRQKPVFGIVHVPVSGQTYYGLMDKGAFKKSNNSVFESIKVRLSETNRVAVRSRSHQVAEESEVLAHFGVSEHLFSGSSIKFCLLAEGKADVYYRHQPTMEWDTAAGQAVLEAAGGQVYSGNSTEKTFTYNKATLLNGSFLALAWK
jgi:3'(2'), 5'-bisphosphate nucleotidase